MRNRSVTIWLVVVAWVYCFDLPKANSITIDFDDYPTDTIIYDQYSALGVLFTGQFSDIFTPSTQGAYDPVLGYEFPSHSGLNGLVASRWERITFLTPVSNVSFYYTNGNPDGFEVFEYDLSGNLLDSLTYYWDLSDTSHIIYANNNWEYTNPQKPLLPNMQVQFNVSGISYVDIQPNIMGGGLAIDDLSFIPEPATLLLLGLGVLMVRRKR